MQMYLPHLYLCPFTVTGPARWERLKDWIRNRGKGVPVRPSTSYCFVDLLEARCFEQHSTYSAVLSRVQWRQRGKTTVFIVWSNVFLVVIPQTDVAVSPLYGFQIKLITGKCSWASRKQTGVLKLVSENDHRKWQIALTHLTLSLSLSISFNT